MHKSSTALIALAVVIIFGILVYIWSGSGKSVVTNVTAKSYKDATYRLAGQSVTLTNGTSVKPVVAGSASKVTTTYFGNEATGDFDGDGRPDTAFILTQSNGGTGTFYYAVAALNTVNGYQGSEGYLLGDRISPQSTSVSSTSVITVNYADRAAGEGFTTAPSVGKSVWLKLDPTTMQFGIVAQDFEGEADPAHMTLGMQTWKWISTIYSNDTTVTPKKPGVFTLTFKKDGSFSAGTDCNAIGGNYTVSSSTITFSKMLSTMMFCEGSQQDAFQKMLTQAQSYHFTSKGELIFDLKFDTGTFIFR